MSSPTRTIEDYVEEVKEYLDEVNYDQIEDVYDTLQRMRYSTKLKHKLNYRRVMQCIGEMTIDRIVTVMVQNDRESCRCHEHSNLLIIMRLFIESLCNVAVIKRVVVFKAKLGVVLFQSVRQIDVPDLSRLTFVALYRCLIVGKTEVAEMYIRYGILKDLHNALIPSKGQSIFGDNALHNVEYCCKLMAGIAEAGSKNDRRKIRRSLALRTLNDYIKKLRANKTTHVAMNPIGDHYSKLRKLLDDDDFVESSLKDWKPKIRLKEEMEVFPDYIFCSSPSCRKQYQEGDHFRYCGACRLARYCSELCQKEHWKKGHKDSCLGEASADDI